MNGTIRILHIGRDRVHAPLDAAFAALPPEFSVRATTSLEVAVEVMAGGGCDIAIMQVRHPETAAMDAFLHLLTASDTVPILCIAAEAQEELALDMVRRGAQECLQSSRLTPRALRHAIRQTIARWRFFCAVQHRATFDEMSGLYNRTGFMRLANYRLTLARRMKASLLMLFVDIDGLKTVNDQFGHAAGDQLIIDAARTLRSTLRESDVIGRIGGDEFCALLGEDNNMGADIVCARIQRAIKKFNAGTRRAYTLSMSVGVEHCNLADAHNILSLEDYIARADMAMYERKRLRPASRSYRPSSYGEGPTVAFGD